MRATFVTCDRCETVVKLEGTLPGWSRFFDDTGAMTAELCPSCTFGLVHGWDGLGRPVTGESSRFTLPAPTP